jgi:hypothetical protein
MYKNTPNKTLMGILLRSGAAKIESPMRSDTKNPEILCSLTPTMWGDSPGAWLL